MIKDRPFQNSLKLAEDQKYLLFKNCIPTRSVSINIFLWGKVRTFYTSESCNTDYQ